MVLRKLTAPIVNEDIEESGGSCLNASSEPSADDDDDGYSPEQYVILKRTGKFY